MAMRQPGPGRGRAWFARIHPKAFTTALKILSRQRAADLARRVGMLGLARKLENAVAASGD
jgi:hypothetical protein